MAGQGTPLEVHREYTRELAETGVSNVRHEATFRNTGDDDLVLRTEAFTGEETSELTSVSARDSSGRELDFRVEEHPYEMRVVYDLNYTLAPNEEYSVFVEYEMGETGTRLDDHWLFSQVYRNMDPNCERVVYDVELVLPPLAERFWQTLEVKTHPEEVEVRRDDGAREISWSGVLVYGEGVRLRCIYYVKHRQWVVDTFYALLGAMFGVGLGPLL